MTGVVRLRSSLPVDPGRYLLRIAAIGGNHTQGSVFTEVTVPKFDGAIALGGLSIAASTTRVTSVNEKDAANAPVLTPLATRDIPFGVPIAAEVAIRADARATALTIAATLRTSEGATIELNTVEREASAFAKPGGDIYRVDLPHGLTAGSYRVIVEATTGRTRVTRELTFRVIRGES